ncbi:MAG: hypothetical protein WCF93_03585 [Candidatus Moraniibacteriota bacterium]
MPTKTKQNKAAGHSDWKNLVQGFVENVFERLSENVTMQVHTWTKQMKRRAIGSVVMVLGITYLLTGLSTFAEATFGKNAPGFGYVFIGAIALAVGYVVSQK